MSAIIFLYFAYRHAIYFFNMKKTYTFILGVLFATFGFSQAVGWNTTLLSQTNTGSNMNDIWGYVDGSENEYAIAGLRDSILIIDVTIPTAPVRLHSIAGPNTTWRDLKTYEDHAYVVHDGVGSGHKGLTIIDLSGLPGSISYKDTIMDGMENSHNVWIDEFGYLYLIGGPGSVNDGFMIYDLNANPEVPSYVGEYTDAYCHDIYVRGNYAYTAEIYGPELGIVDLTDRTSPVKIGSTTYPDAFTHNTWLNDAGDVCFTTDEVSGAFIYSWDVSDPSNIEMLDRIQSSLSSGTAMVHNTHVLNDWLVTSYYKDGVHIVDAARPHNLVEVGWYDTSPASGSGGGGCWGAYPYLPSGNCLASDMSSGMFVFGIDYKRGCYLEGNVTDFATGLPINGASINITGPGVSENSDFVGDYAMGVADSNTYTVTYSMFGYVSQTFNLTLDNGLLVIQDVALVPAATVNFTVNVIDNGSLTGIPNAQVSAIATLSRIDYAADVSGVVSDPAIPQETYTLNVGAWGFLPKQVTVTLTPPNFSTTIGLDRGYYDDFSLDLGWFTGGTASTGDWELGDPVGDFSGGQMMNPEDDVASDFGQDCYVTGVGTGAVGAADIDNGIVILRSPLMDLTTYGDPTISYYRYFANGGGSSALDDTMFVRLNDGSATVMLDTLTDNLNFWVLDSFKVSDYMTPTSTMLIEYVAGDYGDGHLVEAAIDLFQVVDTMPLTGIIADDFVTETTVYPNPFQEELSVDFNLKYAANGSLELVNLLGAVVQTKNFAGNSGHNRVYMKTPTDLTAGVYFLRISTPEGSSVSKILKQK